VSHESHVKATVNEHLNISKQGITLNIHAQPGSRNTSLSGLHGGRIKVRLTAKAVNGAANESLCAFLSEALAVPKSSITLLSGHKSRFKKVLVQGSPTALAETLRKLLSEDQGI
jgi:uncharacterized protein